MLVVTAPLRAVMLPQRVHLELFCLQDRRRDPITSLANKQEEELCDAK